MPWWEYDKNEVIGNFRKCVSVFTSYILSYSTSPLPEKSKTRQPGFPDIGFKMTGLFLRNLIRGSDQEVWGVAVKGFPQYGFIMAPMHIPRCCPSRTIL
jgi:hypothetical protein